MVGFEALLIASSLFFAGGAPAGPESVLYCFHPHDDGVLPRAGVIVDKAGDLFGTTFNGGDGVASEGSVFELHAPATRGGVWKESLIHNFRDLNDGQYPWTGLVAGEDGNLYGTTWLGGEGSCSVETCGVVFQLSPSPFSGDPWTYTILHNFSGSDGGGPEAGMVIDKAGNLYGSTVLGGTGGCKGGGGCGVIFKLARANGRWLESVLYDFKPNGQGYGGTAGDVVMDDVGDLFGTTAQDGGTGTVFELSPPAHGSTWTYKVIYRFRNEDGGFFPLSGLTFDSLGNLYGTTQLGGREGCYGVGCGTVFRLRPLQDGTWAHTTLYRFTGTGDGSLPQYDLTLDAAGNIYGVASGGGTGPGCIDLGCGLVFRLSQRNGGWTEAVLHTFRNGGDGYVPVGRLAFGKYGLLYGTTNGGGNPSCSFDDFGCGTIFSIDP